MLTGQLPDMPRPIPTLVHDVMSTWKDAIESAQLAIRLANERYANNADLKRVDVQFQVGDRVYLSTKHLTLHGQPSAKFRPRFVGLFTVNRRVSSVAYGLDLPKSMRMHPVFHVSLLKAAVSDPTLHPRPPTPEPVMVDGEEEYVVSEVLDIRFSGRTRKFECLVRWEGFGPEFDEWIPESDLLEVVAYDDFIQEWSKSHSRDELRLVRPVRPSRPVARRR
jgi:hypothetical protein